MAHGARVLADDCLMWLFKQPEDSADLVFTSPPYVDARDYGIGYKLKDEAWVNWTADRFMECLRVCRGLVAFVVQGRTRQFQWDCTPAMLACELKRRGAILRNPCIYHRVGVPGSGGPDWFRGDYEWIICATRKRGGLPWSDNTACGHTPKFSPGGAMSNRMKNGRRVHLKHTKRMASGEIEEQGYTVPDKANPGNVIHCQVGGGRMGSLLAHENEAPFSEALAERFVLSFCRPGGTVLDPFCGSGTTGAVAIRHGRSFIGLDIRESQVELSTRRIAEVVNQKREPEECTADHK